MVWRPRKMDAGGSPSIFNHSRVHERDTYEITNHCSDHGRLAWLFIQGLRHFQWPLTVTNIAELQSQALATVIGAESVNNTSRSPAVYVLGYYTPGDRGGGMFEWDPNSSGTPDGGRYFTTNGWTSGNGRWVRRFAGE